MRPAEGWTVGAIGIIGYTTGPNAGRTVAAVAAVVTGGEFDFIWVCWWSGLLGTTWTGR